MDDQSAMLLCPKCVSQMLPVQRFGVQIDQCTGCGGVFLDRGEMEQLAQAEATFYAAAQPPQPAPQQYPPQPQPGYYEPPRRGGRFFEQLFEGEHHGERRYRGHH
ncbi:MAG: zf-TFIIB domain-containing protein [Pseudonocardiaceae bacterium]